MGRRLNSDLLRDDMLLLLLLLLMRPGLRAGVECVDVGKSFAPMVVDELK